ILSPSLTVPVDFEQIPASWIERIVVNGLDGDDRLVLNLRPGTMDVYDGFDIDAMTGNPKAAPNIVFDGGADGTNTLRLLVREEGQDYIAPTATLNRAGTKSVVTQAVHHVAYTNTDAVEVVHATPPGPS